MTKMTILNIADMCLITLVYNQRLEFGAFIYMSQRSTTQLLPHL